MLQAERSGLDPKVFKCFSEILEYPTKGLAEAARECQALVLGHDTEAARCLDAFAALAERNSLGRMEELYTAAFELEATGHPYVGYHLFGETYKRSVFMVELKKRYNAVGLDLRGELPDHLAVMLRFLAANDDPLATREIVREALLPTLDRMTGEGSKTAPSCDDGEQPAPRSRKGYWQVLLALRLVLVANVGVSPQGACTPSFSPPPTSPPPSRGRLGGGARR